MQPVPYLFFHGKAADAFAAYGRIFGAEPEIMRASSMPPEALAQMPGVPADSVMHAAVKVGDGWIYGSDDPSGDTPAMAGCNVAVSLPDEAETRRVWEALSEDGEVRMPLEPTFFAPLFGTLTDRFGTRWMVMTDSPR